MIFSAEIQNTVIQNDDAYRLGLKEKPDELRAISYIEELHESLGKVEGDESQKTEAMKIFMDIIEKLDIKKAREYHFSLIDHVKREMLERPAEQGFAKDIIVNFLKEQDESYALALYRSNPKFFREKVLSGLIDLRKSGKTAEEYLEELSAKTTVNPMQLEIKEKKLNASKENLAKSSCVPDKAVDKYAQTHSETFVVDEEMLKKIATQTIEAKRSEDAVKLQKEGKKPNDESKHQISALGNEDLTHSNDESETILELRETYGGEFPREDPGVTFGEDGIVDFGDFSSFFDSAEEKVDERPEKKDVEEPTVIDTLKDNIKKRAVFLSPKNKEQVLDSFSEVRTQQIKTEADIIIETMKDLDDIIKEVEEELGE